jgi:hypothetical protein
MNKKRVISRDLGTPVARKHIKMKGTGAATKGTKWYAYADQIKDTASPPLKDYVSTAKKV